MDCVKRSIRMLLRLLVLGIMGALLVLLRYILQPSQPLTDVLSGEASTYIWTHRRLAYKVFGPLDAPALVLLHEPALGSSSYDMRHIIGELALHYRVYALDLLGFGQSDRPRITYSSDTYVELCLGFLSDEVARPATILASGLSCNYAVAIASQAPALCERLVLVSPTEMFKKRQTSLVLDKLLKQQLLSLWFYALLTVPAILRQVIARQRRLPPQALSADTVASVTVAAHQRGARYAVLAALAGRVHGNVAHQFEALSQPVLILWGAQAVSDARLVTGQQDLSERVQVLFVRDAGLRVHEEQPTQLVANMLDWQGARSITIESAGIIAPPVQSYKLEEVLYPQSEPVIEQPAAVEMVSVEPPEPGIDLPEVSEDQLSTVISAPIQAQPAIPAVESVEPMPSQSLTQTSPAGDTETLEAVAGVKQVDPTPTEAYCVRCRKKRSMQGAHKVNTKNGRSALEGICPVCGTRLFRFIK